MTAPNPCPTETAGLPGATRPTVLDFTDGEQFDLRIAPVVKPLGPTSVRMLAYNGSVPGPTLRVQQGSELTVNVVNDGDLDASVHWHGLRLDNRYDGTADTQPPMPVGGRFTYRLTFPDPGIYWYHPHIREDYGQELGLYGTIVVVPSDAGYWPPANRELALTLDDILIEHGQVAPFDRSETTHTAMGRFGNVMLVNGETNLSLSASTGEVVRFFLTNTANTRVFNIAFRGARMKLVGGDSGRSEREEFVPSVLIAPSERAVVDVLFDRPGEARLEHVTPQRTYGLARVDVSEQQVERSFASAFETLRINADMTAERERVSGYLQAPPAKTLSLVAEMRLDTATDQSAAGPYVCPMHPEITSDHADRCGICGMKLVPTAFVEAADAAHQHGHEHHHEGVHEHGSGRHANDESGVASVTFPAGIEWEDDMEAVNRLTTPANMRWQLIDRPTGAAGAAIDWHFRVGERVKIRLVNEMDSDHPMHHPFHIHGAGRFLVVSRDGVVEPNLVWKDTVLVRTGQTVDLLLEVTNPGLWMAHCHIAEHHESGMMLRFRVDA